MRSVLFGILCGVFFSCVPSVFAQSQGSCGSSYALSQNICPSSCNWTQHSSSGPKANQYCCGYIYDYGTSYESCRATAPTVVSCGNGFATDENATCQAGCPKSSSSYFDSATGEIKYCCGYVKKTAQASSCTTVLRQVVGCGAQYLDVSSDSEFQVTCNCTGSANQAFRMVAGEGIYKCCGVKSDDGTQCLPPRTTVTCGTAFNPTSQACNCPGASSPLGVLPSGQTCCGWLNGSTCAAEAPSGPLACSVYGAYFYQEHRLTTSFSFSIPRGTDPSGYFPLQFRLQSADGSITRNSAVPLSACDGDFSSGQTCTRSFASLTASDLGLTETTEATTFTGSITGQGGTPSCQTTITFPAQKKTASCGEEFSSEESMTTQCTCSHQDTYQDRVCCGWFTADHRCIATQPPNPSPTGSKEPPKAEGGTTGGASGVTAGTFDALNQAIFGGNPDPQLTTPRGIISKLLPFLFIVGGMILFIMLVWGGYEMLLGAANPKSQEAGKQRITAAVVGFLLLFVSYWFAQIVQIIFGISIL